MARQLRHEYPGATYHITSRGNAGGSLFLDTLDEDAFLRILTRVVSAHSWLCHAYCLMGNHYHVVIETPQPNLALGMRRLNSTYAQAFNERHDRVGHVFQGRYKAILIEKDAHLLEVSRYVVLNPVRAGLCNDAGAWRTSSYGATAGSAPRPPFLTVDWVLSQFAERPVRARERYMSFVAEGAGLQPWRDLRGAIYLGSERFAARASGGGPIAEVPRAQWNPVRRPLAELLRPHGDAAVEQAYREGYSMREIAEHLEVHYATVSRRLRRLERLP